MGDRVIRAAVARRGSPLMNSDRHEYQ